MKLHGEAIDMKIVTQVTRIVSLFAKQSKTLILKFTKDHVYILAEPEVTDRSMKLWTEVPQSTLFSHYEIVGVPPDNTIYLKTKAENLMNSLKTATNCRSLKIKLRQRTTPCLSLEFEQSSQLTTKNRIIYNYIDVEVVYKRFWARYDEPNLPPPDITVILPATIQLNSFTAKCRNFVSNLYISATGSRELVFRVKGESLEITRKFLNISTDEDGLDLTLSASVTVDIKRVANFFKTLHLAAGTQVCLNLTDERIAHFSFFQDGITVQFVVPHII
ncbi:checkpoint protein HUS1-like [Panonychus citri]|uniref:checkpoint protein HUS1-like n=1 Tax=Panonychus citri TaxID=50023 RepID=UPI00230805F1|nr:checkpoint protein HUS1-like [Panonychus citri]